MIRKKILLLGYFSVGKTSLVKRYIDGAFEDKYLTTIGVNISKKVLTLAKVKCEMLIWDIEGSTPNEKISLSYYRGASGAIFVTDVTREETMKGLEVYKEIFLSENPDSKFIVAHNKIDMLSSLAKEKMEQEFEAVEDVFLTSAQDGQNIEPLFIKLMENILS